MARKKGKKIISSTVFYIFVAGIATVIILPIYFLVSISFMSDQEAYDWPIALAPAFSNTFLLQQYIVDRKKISRRSLILMIWGK